MNLSELERLANLPPCQVDWCDRKDVLAMIELLREMGEALEKYQNRESLDDLEDAGYAFDYALAKYREMTK